MMDDHFEDPPLVLPEGNLVLELRKDDYRRLYYQQGSVYILNEGWDSYHWTEKSFASIEEIMKELDNWSMAIIDENFQNVGNYLRDWMWLELMYVGEELFIMAISNTIMELKVVVLSVSESERVVCWMQYLKLFYKREMLFW